MEKCKLELESLRRENDELKNEITLNNTGNVQVNNYPPVALENKVRKGVMLGQSDSKMILEEIR